MLIFVCVYAINTSGYNNAQFVILFSIPIIILSSFSFEFTVYFLILTLFANIQISKIFPSEIASLLIAFSFLLTYKFKIEEVKNDLNKFFLVFVISAIPSFFNSVNIPLTILYSFRLFAFFIVLTAIQISITEYDQVKRYLTFFVVMSVLNGLYVIFLSVTTGLREFGFAGIWYVDYVGVALVISVVFLLYSKKYRLYSIVSTVILTLALIFTQTRNAWLSAGLTIFLILIHFVITCSKMGYNRKRVIFWILLFTALLALVSIQAHSLNPGVFKRVSSQSLEPLSESQSGDVTISSFITRFFIWHTAYQAFLAHPLTGIGLYSFPFSSQYYFTIDPIFYKLFVKNLPAHTTVLALLAEVGIIGTLGFLIFLTSVFKLLINNLKKSISELNRLYSLMLIFLQVFILISMIMTDAWLWGNQLMLWAMLLAFSVSNKKLIASNSVKSIHE